MRILVISHCVFSKTENMGKTLSGYFTDFSKSELAQFYIHSEVPTTSICEKYYRITDKDIIKSILTFKSGKVFSKKDICEEEKTSRTDKGSEAKMYQLGRKRTPIIYILRNLWWKLGHWNTKKFRNWIDDFNPGCVFFASGDYSFMYNIAYKIAKTRNIPLYISCMDDYYINNKNSTTFLGRIHHKNFMKCVHKTANYSTAFFCICEKMSQDYQKLFNKNCYTIHTSASFDKPLNSEKKNKISYIGNLGYKRYEQLIRIGKTLKQLNGVVNHIDVYSSESRPEILKKMIPENGIVFHGAVSSEEVKKVIAESLAVIHTESFGTTQRESVKYSVSTKIADSLMSGTCILAFGPPEIASMQYLSDNDAAVCVFDERELTRKLDCLLNDDKFRKKISNNAKALAKKNHLPGRTSEVIGEIISAF